MQSQSVQTWTGCSETISLAKMIPLEERVQTPALSEDSPLRIGLPPSEPVIQWKPGTAEDLSIARIEESRLPAPTLASLHARDYSVSSTASRIEMGPDRCFRERSPLGLWTTVSPAAPNELEALRVSPEAPTEVKFRIWIQPLEESSRRQLPHAADRLCPPVVLAGLEAWTAALDHSPPADEVRTPGVDGFSVRGLVTRAGTPLQSVVTLAAAELEYLLYPGSRRIPMAGTLTIG
jgi:hypothetical protein